MISTFSGDHEWLSNFFPVEVVLDGVTYPSVENAYQASKFPADQRDVFRYLTPAQAKRKGRGVQPPVWRVDHGLRIMRDLIDQKFAEGTALAWRLLDTGYVQLVEGNWWKDTFWGECDGVGDNRLGQMLMDRRDVLRQLINED